MRRHTWRAHATVCLAPQRDSSIGGEAGSPLKDRLRQPSMLDITCLPPHKRYAHLGKRRSDSSETASLITPNAVPASARAFHPVTPQRERDKQRGNSDKATPEPAGDRARVDQLCAEFDPEQYVPDWMKERADWHTSGWSGTNFVAIWRLPSSSGGLCSSGQWSFASSSSSLLDLQAIRSL